MRCAPSVRKSRKRTTESSRSLQSVGSSGAASSSFGRLDGARLRSLLRPTLSAEPCSGAAEEHGREKALIPAAVLFPVVLHEAEPTVLLTQRDAGLKHHPGQISFPGGRIEADDPSPIHAALREAEEEIGLLPQRVEVIGLLPHYRTVTGFCITPVVGLIQPPLDLRPDSAEVAAIFEVPLSFLMDPANHQRHAIRFHGKKRQYDAVPYGEHYIWGATAGMILEMSRRLHD